MYQNKSKIAVIIGFFIVSILLVIVMIVLIRNANKPKPVPVINQTELELNESIKKFDKLLFDYKIVRTTNNYYNSNYLVSPKNKGEEDFTSEDFEKVLEEKDAEIKRLKELILRCPKCGTKLRYPRG